MAASGMGEFEWDVASDAVELSPRAAEIFGVAAGEPVTRLQLIKLLDPGDAAVAQVRMRDAIAGRSDYEAEYRVRRGDGQVVWVATRGRGEFDGAGKLVRLLGVMQDVTERKAAAEALRDEALVSETLR